MPHDRSFAAWVVGLIAALTLAPAARAASIGPTAYTGFSGSPFDGVAFSSWALEDFEDGLLNTAGVSASAGLVLAFVPGRDSVDPNGNSFWSNGSTTLTFTFSGTLPTHAGVVWTDVGCLISEGAACPPTQLGAGDVFFEAFDASNVSLGVIGPSFLGDGASDGGTAEDRFFGATNAGGISKIVMWMPDSSDWELDHLQYGVAVPEPSVALLLAIGVTALAARRPRA